MFAFYELLLHISPFFYRILMMSVSAVLAGVVILFIRTILDRQIPPFGKSLMWFVVLAALVIPLRIESHFAPVDSQLAVSRIPYSVTDFAAIDAMTGKETPPMGSAPAFNASDETGTAGQNSPANETASDISENTSKGSAPPFLLPADALIFDLLIPGIWIFGMLLTAIFLLVGNAQLRRGIRVSEKNDIPSHVEDILMTCHLELGMNRTVPLVFQDYVITPAVFGLLRPHVLLPDYMTEMDEDDFFHVVCHELSHIRRGDHLVNNLLLLLQILHWFNPLVWILSGFVRKDLEVANDAALTANMDKDEKKQYSFSLIRVLEKSRAPALAPKLLCMTDSARDIERRIRMIRQGERFKKLQIRTGAASAILVLLIGMVFFTVDTSAVQKNKDAGTLHAPNGNAAANARDPESVLPLPAQAIPAPPGDFPWVIREKDLQSLYFYQNRSAGDTAYIMDMLSFLGFPPDVRVTGNALDTDSDENRLKIALLVSTRTARKGGMLDYDFRQLEVRAWMIMAIIKDLNEVAFHITYQEEPDRQDPLSDVQVAIPRNGASRPMALPNAEDVWYPGETTIDQAAESAEAFRSYVIRLCEMILTGQPS